MKNNHPRKSTRSIRFQLVIAVNSVLLLFAIAFLVFDYGRELRHRFDEKKTSLQEEAKTLLPSVLHLKSHGLDTVQTYVDDVCGRMEDSDSPSHHIAVEMDGKLIQAHAHHRASPDLVAAMKAAANSPSQRLQTESNDLIVGTLSQGETSVFVSEDVSQVRAQVFSDEIRRMWALVLMGLLGAAIVNFVLVRMVSRPLRVLVDKVREVGEGDFSTQLGTFGSEEFDYLSAEINSMSTALATSEANRKLRLDKARKIQENLLPEDVNIPHVDVGMVYRPAEEVGGDYFDILPHGNDGWLICIADATDHGVPAAMTAAMLKTLLLQTKDHAISPSKILAQMNSVFMKVNLYGDFASIILLRIDLKAKTLTYANAGHDPAWLIDGDQQPHELLATGTLLGILEDGDWKDETVQFSEGCRLAISTDGITETFKAAEKEFGKQRLLDLLLQHCSLSATETAELVHASVREFRGEENQKDDVTLLLMDWVMKQSETDQEPDCPTTNAANDGLRIHSSDEGSVAEIESESTR